MNKTIGRLLVVYSLLLAGLSYLAFHLAPGVSRPTLIAGLAGGGFCLVWGILALNGSKRKALAILTLIPVAFTLMPQAFAAWSDQGGGWEVAALKTLLLLLSVGMLVRIAWSGALFDLPTSRDKPAGERA